MQRDHEYQHSPELGRSWHESDLRRADMAVASSDIVAQLILCRALFAWEASPIEQFQGKSNHIKKIT
jgi:hypothetical protein